MGRTTDGALLLETARETFESLGHPNLAWVCLDIGSMHLDQNRLDAADHWFRRADALFEEMGKKAERVRILLHLVTADSQRLRFKSAFRHLAEAETLLDDVEDPADHITFAMASAKLSSAVANKKRSIRKWTDIEPTIVKEGRLFDLAAIRHNRGVDRLVIGDVAGALKDTADSAEVIADLIATRVRSTGADSAGSLRGKFRECREVAIRAVTKLDQPTAEQIADAYDVIQVFQGLGLAETMVDSRVESFASREFASRLDRLDNQLAQERRRLDGLGSARSKTLSERKKRNAKRKEIRKKIVEVSQQRRLAIETERLRHPHIMSLRYPRAASSHDVAATLPETAAFIEYAVNRSTALAFVITRDTTLAVPLGRRRSIAEAVSRILKDLRAGGDAVEARRELGRLALDPILAKLEDSSIRTLIIAPNGKLWALRPRVAGSATSNSSSKSAPGEWASSIEAMT